MRVTLSHCLALIAPQWVTSQSCLLDSAHPCLKKAAVYFYFGRQYNEVTAYWIMWAHIYRVIIENPTRVIQYRSYCVS